MDEGLVCCLCQEYITYSQVEKNIIPNDKLWLCRCPKCKRPIEISNCKPYFLKKKDERCTNCNNEIIWNKDNKGQCIKCGLYYKVKE